VEIACGIADDSSAVGANAGSVQLRGTAMPEIQTFAAGAMGGQLATSGQARGDSQRYDLRPYGGIVLKSGQLEFYGAISGADTGAPQIWVVATILTAGSGLMRTAIAPSVQAFA